MGWAVGKGLWCVSELKNKYFTSSDMRSETFSNAGDSQTLTEGGETPVMLSNTPVLLPKRKLNAQCYITSNYFHLLFYVWGCVFWAFEANEPYELSRRWAAFKWRLRIIGALKKPLNSEKEAESMAKIQQEKKTHVKWVAWGTVLFVLSDPVMHFSLWVCEETLQTTKDYLPQVR